MRETKNEGEAGSATRSITSGLLPYIGGEGWRHNYGKKSGEKSRRAKANKQKQTNKRKARSRSTIVYPIGNCHAKKFIKALTAFRCDDSSGLHSRMRRKAGRLTLGISGSLNCIGGGLTAIEEIEKEI